MCCWNMSLLFSVTSLLAWFFFYTKGLGNNFDRVDCSDSSWDDPKSRFKQFSARKPDTGKNTLVLGETVKGKWQPERVGFQSRFLAMSL